MLLEKLAACRLFGCLPSQLEGEAADEIFAMMTIQSMLEKRSNNG